MIDIIKVFVLSLVEGLTEFIPVSSTGHLILVNEFVKLEPDSFANMFDKAHRSKGVTGEVLLQLCESRLDNVVYRLGFAKTRAAARQLVSHRHITVNGELVNIPSYSLSAGDVVAVRVKSKSLEVVADALASKSNYEWLQYNDEKREGVFISAPERLQIPEDIKEQLIVELYSK